MRLILGGSYDLTEYVLTRPRVKSVSNVVNGGLYLPETSISLKYRRGLFDAANPVFRPDVSVEIYNDSGDLVFFGYLRGVQHTFTETTLSCVHYLNKALSGNVNFSATASHPANILATFFDSIGQAHQGILSHASRYPAMLVQVFAVPENGVKAYDFISSLCDIMSLDIVVDAGIVYGIDRTQTESPYPVKSMAYPQVIDDGTSRQVKGCNLRYLFDADIPFAVGQQTEYCWSADYGPNNYLQIFGAASAQEVCKAKLDRLATPKQVIQLKCRADGYLPRIGLVYLLDIGPVRGYYRVIGQETDGELWYPMLEAV